MRHGHKKNRARRLVYGALESAGIIGVWRWFCRYHLTCAVIHGIGAPQEGDQWTPVRWRIRQERLDEYLAVLKRHYTFVDISTAVGILRGAVRVRHPLLLTIDDGYRNAVTHGLPVFRKHGVRPVVFIVTGHVETREPFWFDRLDYALQRAIEKNGHTSIDELDGIVARSPNLAAVTRAYIRWTREKYRDDRQRREYLREVVERLEDAAGSGLTLRPEGDHWCALLTAEEIRAASASGIDFGSHTVHHYRLGDVPDDVVKLELAESRAALERVTGVKCTAFCFPEGSFDERSKRFVQEAGYDCAFTSDSGLNEPGCDAFSLRRIHLPADESPGELLARISAFDQALLAAVGRRRKSRIRVKSFNPSLANG